MNIQIYAGKKNPDVLKAERFFKERRIPYQFVDTKKHPIGKRELQLMARAVGATALVDRSSPKALERPVAHMSDEELILSILAEDSTPLVCPIVRNGNRVTVGADEETWRKWMSES